MANKARQKQYAISKRFRNVIIVLCLLTAVVLVVIDNSCLAPKLKQSTDEHKVSYDWQKYTDKQFSVVKVVDGDTIDIDIPDGDYKHTRIRLWGIDTPETKSSEYGIMYFGPEAAGFTTGKALGKIVLLYLDKTRTRDKYGRLLAYVKLPDGIILNEILLTEGFAYADLRFRHDFYHRYLQLEASARRQKKGLWKQITRDKLPEWLKKRKPKMLLEK